jgi:ankyrin repeat protein
MNNVLIHLLNKNMNKPSNLETYFNNLKLLNSAVREHDIRTARKLLTEEPRLIDSIDYDEWNIIHHCSRIGTPEILKMLVEEFNADIDSKTAYRYTPAIIAASYKNLPCLIELIKLGADFELEDRSGRKPVDYFIEENNDLKVLEKYLDDINLYLIYENYKLKIKDDKNCIEIELN